MRWSFGRTCEGAGFAWDRERHPPCASISQRTTQGYEGIPMRTTPQAENAEIDDARLALQNARRELAQAARDGVDTSALRRGLSVPLPEGDDPEANAPLLSPLADAREAQWVRVALLERRERDALTAHARGDRR